METLRHSKEPVVWQYMDALSVWGKEFLSALGRTAPAIGWIPELKYTGAFQRWQREVVLNDPPLRAHVFPVQRGYRRGPIGRLAGTFARQQQLLTTASRGYETAVLVVTSPYYAPLANRWNGPVVYYVTDLLVHYGGFNQSQILRLDRELSTRATMVCPNSERIASYFQNEAFCPANRIAIIPNATRRQNLLPEVPNDPGPLPDDIVDVRRPVAGVIGNLAANLDWPLLGKVVEATPFLRWVFVGPATDDAGGRESNEARARLMQMGGRVRFTGAKPYGALCCYARAFDVAVMPYRKSEPTYSGSSTRFYEHLAACRPILATRGFAELLEKEPLLRLAADAEEMTAHLEELQRAGFQDGYERLRWRTSLGETWEARASAVREGLERCCAQPAGIIYSGVSR